MTTPDTLARILTLRVDLRDEKACAEITPEMANAYLRAKGWRLTRDVLWNCWHLGDGYLMTPRRTDWPDYGRRVLTAIGEIADAEQRSPLAVWVDMMAQKETAA